MAETILSQSQAGAALILYPLSGNAGSWPAKIDQRPSNWWDTIGFGYEDAYANAPAYRALRSMGELAERHGEAVDAKRYRQKADGIRLPMQRHF